MQTLTTYRSEAERIVRAAGRIAAQAYPRAKETWRKGDGSEVTRCDVDVEKAILAGLGAAFPDAGFLCEESGEQDVDREFVWILDPIDGTSYFARQVPVYSISLGLRRGEELVLGVVYHPQTDECFTAEAGRGAWRNGEPITCSTTEDLSSARLAVEIPGRDAPEEMIATAMYRLGKLVNAAERVRVFGASAWGLCYTASGGFDAYLALSGGSKIWDIAAGRVILEQSGGLYTTCHDHAVVAGPRALHDALIELLDLTV